MCGVGKFQKLWNTKASDACPHCGNPEDALHVWKCQSETVSETWSNSLKILESSLNKLDTDPYVKYLNAWRYNYNLHSLKESKIRSLLDLQETIGARQFFKGWLHKEWENRQEHYYRTSNSKHSGKRWTIALITKLWDIAWDLWDHHNEVYHKQMNYTQEEDKEVMDLQIQDLYDNMVMTGLLPKDQHLLSIPLHRIIAFPRPRKVEWIEQSHLAVAQAKKRNFNL
jgi:hypothetical protein